MNLFCFRTTDKHYEATRNTEIKKEDQDMNIIFIELSDNVIDVLIFLLLHVEVSSKCSTANIHNINIININPFLLFYSFKKMFI